MSGIIIIIFVVVVIDITVTEMLSDRSPDWIEDTWMNIYLVTVFTNAVVVQFTMYRKNVSFNFFRRFAKLFIFGKLRTY